MNPALFDVPRHERRKLIATEERLRKAGAWGAWEKLTLSRPADFGHVGVFRTVHRNRVFAVLDRMDFSGARHLGISSLSGTRPTWPEAQRIKNELAGEHMTAIEVYPPQAEVVDQANMYHLWVVPGPLPFSLAERHDLRVERGS
jgi:hypothetical protein